MNVSERIFEGIAVSPGIAIGRAHVANREGVVAVEPRELGAGEVEAEIERFRAALGKSREQLMRIRQQVAEALDEKHADIYTAQAAMLDDDELVGATVMAIKKEKMSADFLFHRKVTELMKILRGVEDEFFRARDSDILDVANRVINNLNLVQDGGAGPISPESIIVAHDLPPSQATSLMKEHVIGLVLEKGGPTSHTAIMAKALELPAVVGVSDVTLMIENGARVIVDGLAGRIVLNPSAETLAKYSRELKDFSELERELDLLRDEPAETKDGYVIDLRANIELPEEIAHLKQHGATGVGLFRTEFMLMSKGGLASEAEQTELYMQVAGAVKPDPVVFRTLDIGGDKFLSKVPVAPQLNPFMGQRAIRLCLQHPDLFREQLRAIVRASMHGNVRLLVPMISGIEEFIAVKKHVQHVKTELRAARLPFDPKIKLGALIEVPSAAVTADILARHCDFFSIGTNDLIQYSLAVDRGNESVAYLYEPLHPAILRLLRTIITAGHKHGIPVSVCGEMAADPMFAVILLGMGVDELSMSAVSIPAVKKIIRSVRLQEAKMLAEEILVQTSIEGARNVVRRRLKSYLKKRRA